MFGKLQPRWISLLGGFYLPFAVAGFLLGITRGIRLPLLVAPCGAALAHAIFHRVYDSWGSTLEDRHYLPMILVSALGSLLGFYGLRAYKKLFPAGAKESTSTTASAKG